MLARLATGEKFEASEITDAHPLKKGPWFCAGTDCDVQYHFHRSGGPFNRGDTTSWRQATFVHGAVRQHGPTCEYNERAERQRLQNQYGSLFSTRGETLLLRYRRADRPTEPAPSPEPRAHGQTRESYAAVMEAALDVASVIDRIGEATLSTYWVRHQGTNYTWPQFSYGPSPQDLRRLVPSVQGQISTQPWPRLARAMVADRGALNPATGKVVARMRAEAVGPDGKYVRFWMFAEAGTPAAELLGTLSAGQHYAVLGHDWFYLDRTEEAGLNITDATQLARVK